MRAVYRVPGACRSAGLSSSPNRRYEFKSRCPISKSAVDGQSCTGASDAWTTSNSQWPGGAEDRSDISNLHVRRRSGRAYEVQTKSTAARLTIPNSYRACSIVSPGSSLFLDRALVAGAGTRPSWSRDGGLRGEAFSIVPQSCREDAVKRPVGQKRHRARSGDHRRQDEMMAYHVGHFAPHAWPYSTQSPDAVKGRRRTRRGSPRKEPGT